MGIWKTLYHLEVYLKLILGLGCSIPLAFKIGFSVSQTQTMLGLRHIDAPHLASVFSGIILNPTNVGSNFVLFRSLAGTRYLDELRLEKKNLLHCFVPTSLL